MNRTSSILALSIFALAALPSCSSSSPPTDDTATVAAALVGDWQDTCFDAGNGEYAQLTFHIQTGLAWEVDYVVYGDASCSAALGDVHIAGDYQIVGPSSVVAGADDAIFSFSTRTVTPKAQPFADFLNSQKGCGAGEWKVGVAQDVYEAGCAALGSYPKASCTADYDIVKVGATTLQLGARPADNDMCTADKRPTMLETDACHRLE